MMESPSVLRPERTLSTAERIELIRTLNGLPLSQLLELEFVLDVPKGIMPAPSEALGVRNRALLGWVEGASGSGWNAFLEVLKEVTGISLTPKTQRLKVVIEGDIAEADSGLLLKMLADLQAKADAPSLKISSIKAGSIELTLQGTPEELEHLKQLIESGQLVEVAGRHLVRRIRRSKVFSDLSGADLSGADLSGASLSRVDLSEVNLSEADLSGANLEGANLEGANLSGADLLQAILRQANFNGANLIEANLSEAYLIEANLNRANLVGANLAGANLSEANLSEANLNRVNPRRAIFGRNLGLQKSDIAYLIALGAIFPDITHP